MINDIELHGILAGLERQSALLVDYSLDVFLEYDFNEHAILDGSLTGGHVLTYLAREADRMADELLEATGQRVPEPDRNRRWELSENGNLRPAAVMVDDIQVSTERLRAAVASVAKWSALAPEVRVVPARRFLQLIVHFVDLGRPWSRLTDEDARLGALVLADVLTEELADHRLVVDDRACGLEWRSAGQTIDVSATARTLLAWATGRTGEGTDALVDVGDFLPSPARRVWI